MDDTEKIVDLCNEYNRKAPIQYKLIYDTNTKSFDSKKSLKQRLNIQTNLKEIGFKETLNDDDFKYETELWFYGGIIAI